MANTNTFPAKYEKLANDLAEAHIKALHETANVDDGGTCNFDSPVLKLPRWNKELVRKAADMAGVGCFPWHIGEPGWWVFVPRVGAQANRRTKCAELMSKFLKELGYDASMYYQMD